MPGYIAGLTILLMLGMVLTTVLLLWCSLISFGQSFRVGPDKLVTSRVFAFSHNPMYVAFALIFTGSSRSSLIGFSWSIWLQDYGYSTARCCRRRSI